MVSSFCSNVYRNSSFGVVSLDQIEFFRLIERARVMTFHNFVVRVSDQKTDALAIDDILYDRSIRPAFPLWKRRRSIYPTPVPQPDEKIEIVLEALIARIELERLASPFHCAVHRIEMPRRDRAQVEQAEAPGVRV